jgi:hypothetical protein
MRDWPWYSDLTEYVQVLNYCQLLYRLPHKIVHYNPIYFCSEFLCVIFAALCCAAFCCVVLRCVVLCCAVLCCAVLCCIVMVESVRLTATPVKETDRVLKRYDARCWLSECKVDFLKTEFAVLLHGRWRNKLRVKEKIALCTEHSVEGCRARGEVVYSAPHLKIYVSKR